MSVLIFLAAVFALIAAGCTLIGLVSWALGDLPSWVACVIVVVLIAVAVTGCVNVFAGRAAAQQPTAHYYLIGG